MDEEEEQKWIDRVLQFGHYTEAKLLARGGMGAAFKVSMRDHSRRAVARRGWRRLPERGQLMTTLT